MRRYGVALGATALAYLVTWWGFYEVSPRTYLYFFPAVALTAWYGGRGPAIVSTVVSTGLIGYFFAYPRNGFSFADATEIADLVVFLSVALFITMLSENLRTAKADSEALARKLHRLQEITSMLARTRTSEEVAERFTEHVLPALGADRGWVGFIDGYEGALEVIARSGYETRFSAASLELSLDRVFPATEVQPKRVWIKSTGDDWSHEELEEAFARSGVNRLVGVPLIGKENAVEGAAILGFASQDPFESVDRDFAAVTARQLGEAVRRAHEFLKSQRARREAEEAASDRETVLAAVSHDLRDPLNLVKMNASLLRSGDLVPFERRDDFLEMIENAADRMSNLITDLLELAKFEAGKLRLQKRPVHLARAIENELETLQPRAHARNVTLSLKAEEGLPAVPADNFRLCQVIDNLVGNAIAFTSDGGRVEVEVGRQADAAVICVRDEGPGISGEEQSSLFQAFWQGSGGSVNGVGLGLAIVKEIVEAHRGRIWVESQPGEGAAFSFTLPLALDDAEKAPRELSFGEH